MADVFISYARAEFAIATAITHRLESLGLTVFIDVAGLDGGDVFTDRLDHEVKTAGAVLGLWSPLALTRPWVRIECDIGKRRGVLIPAAIIAFDELDVPANFWNIQFIDLTALTDRPDDPNWILLIRSIVRSCGRQDVLAKILRSATDQMGGVPTEIELVPQAPAKQAREPIPKVRDVTTEKTEQTTQLAFSDAALGASQAPYLSRKREPKIDRKFLVAGLAIACIIAVALFVTRAANGPLAGSAEWCKATPMEKQVEDPTAMGKCLEGATS